MIKNPFSNLANYFIIISFCTVICFFWVNKENFERFNADNYVGYAFNLSINNTFSGTIEPSDKVVSSMRRAPGYPWFLSGVFFLTNQHKNLSECFQKQETKSCRNIFFIIKVTQSILFFFTILLVFETCQLFHKNRFINVIVSLLSGVILSKEIISHSHSESLSLPLFAAFTYLISRWTIDTNNKNLFAIFSGFFYGLLILTRSVYLYYFPIFFFLFIILYLLKNNFLAKKLSSLVLFVIITLMVISPWQYRNYSLFNDFSISNSGVARVLAIREEYNKMSGKEYLAGFIYWAPIPVYNKIFQKNLTYAPFQRYRMDNKNSFRQVGINYANTLSSKYDSKKVRSLLLEKIISKPFSNLKMSLLFGWRGIHYSAVFFPFFLFVIFKSFSERRYNHFILIFSLTLFTLLFHSGITHFNVRYGYPLIFGFAPSCCLFFKMWLHKKP